MYIVQCTHASYVDRPSTYSATSSGKQKGIKIPVALDHPLELVVSHKLDGGFGRDFDDVDAVAAPHGPPSALGQHVSYDGDDGHLVAVLRTVNLQHHYVG